jgi:UDP-4-amino-4,6-dideoxy-N-acetyl-beta-L-altrosamine N-acetyltransferase
MLTYQDYRMRPMEEKDLERVLEWRNSDRVRQNSLTDQLIALEEHRKWFARIKDGTRDQFFVFEYLKRPLGVISFNLIDRTSEKCSWGFYLGETDGPPMAGIVMEYMALEYAFEELNMRKLYGEVLAFNSRVIKLHQLFGFKEEGRLIKHVIKNGKYEDLVLIAIFQESWEEKRILIKNLIN